MVTLSANIELIFTTVLAFIRVSGLFLMTPLFSIANIPNNVKIIFLFGLTVLLVAGLNVQPVEAGMSFSELVFAGLLELMVGMTMGLVVFCAFAAFQFGGRVLDFQMGFGVANLIDPATNNQSPLIGTILNMMAVMTFYMLNGHHYMIRGLAYSFEKIPVGQGFSKIPIDAVLYQFGLMFIYGFMLVTPVVMTLLLLDVGLAIAARTMPQVNIFIVSLPLKIFVGLLVLTFSLNYMSPLLKRIFESIFRQWELSFI